MKPSPASTSPSMAAACAAAQGGDGRLPPGGLSVAFERDFGSIARWQDEFLSALGSMGGANGWAVLGWSSAEARLVVSAVPDANRAPDGIDPLLAVSAGDATPAALSGVRWDAVGEAYAGAVERASEGLGVAPQQASSNARRRIDVRRAAIFDGADELIAGAVWRDPAAVDAWASELPREQPVLVYCIHGLEVGRSTALALRRRGIDARFLAGGIADWKALDLPMEAKS